MSGQSQEPTLSPTYYPGSPTLHPSQVPTASPTILAAWTTTDTIITSVVVSVVFLLIIVVLYSYHVTLANTKAGYDMVPTHDHEHAHGAEPGESKPLQDKTPPSPAVPAEKPPRAEV